uniref:Uncharacterized protein n=1 Tax=Kalanchoe fedtschenkoi TaxID=63787 RepID=A0A7N0V2R4_KALFE
MPDNVKGVIDAMGGTGAVLVIQKRLFDTDVKKHNNRLQIPRSKIPTDSLGFLSEDEENLLATRDRNGHLKHIETRLLDPRLVWRDIKLRKWDMSKKKSGPYIAVYVLNHPWIDIVKANELKADNLVQVWAFRAGDNKLHLALVKIDERE